MINLFGTVLFLIPGYLLTLIFFKDSDLLEKILFYFIFTVSVSVVIGVILGFNEFTYKLTGGFNNLFYFYLAFDLILLFAYVMKEKKGLKFKKTKKGK